MADVVVSDKQLQITLSLARQSESVETATRAFTVDLPAGDTEQSAKTRATAFKANYMQNFANTAYSGNNVGSLIQVTNWRDNDVNEDALKCIDMKISYIDKQQTYFDI